MGRIRAKSDYENLRNARILENKARLASLGVQKSILELRSINKSKKSEKTHVKKYNKVDYSSNPLRRSNRLKGKKSGSSVVVEYSEDEDSSGKSPPSVRRRNGSVSSLSPHALGQRCTSKWRGSLYDPVYGICCHFCRQKKLCGEEDCKRCGNLDIDQPCIGKTECSACHSSTGVFCRGCLKIRYGEDIDDVKANKNWMCPHCIEEKGLKPYWICNSSLCLKKRKMTPTGVTIFKAREMGFESAAHLLMDTLSKADHPL